jgi:hypothetical protein
VAGFLTGSVGHGVRPPLAAAAPGPRVQQRSAAVDRVDEALRRLGARRNVARARLRSARDAHAQSEQATALADAYGRARRVAAGAAVGGAPALAAHLATAETAYRRLAAAATHGDRSGYDRAADDVVRAERALATGRPA